MPGSLLWFSTAGELSYVIEVMVLVWQEKKDTQEVQK